MSVTVKIPTQLRSATDGEATAEVEPATGTVVQAFTSGTVVQIFLLAGNVPGESWSESVSNIAL